MRTFYSKSFPVFPSALASPPLSFLTLHPPSTLPRVCHAVTFSQRAHSDLVHRQSCCCVGGCVRACTYFSFLPTRSLLSTILTKSESVTASACTHRHVIDLSSRVRVKPRAVNKCALTYLSCTFHTVPCIQRQPAPVACVSVPSRKC